MSLKRSAGSAFRPYAPAPVKRSAGSAFQPYVAPPAAAPAAPPAEPENPFPEIDWKVLVPNPTLRVQPLFVATTTNRRFPKAARAPPAPIVLPLQAPPPARIALPIQAPPPPPPQPQPQPAQAPIVAYVSRGVVRTNPQNASYMTRVEFLQGPLAGQKKFVPGAVHDYPDCGKSTLLDAARVYPGSNTMFCTVCAARKYREANAPSRPSA